MTTRPAPRIANATPWRRPQPIAVGVAVSLLLHLALGGWLALRRAPEPTPSRPSTVGLNVRLMAAGMAAAAATPQPRATPRRTAHLQRVPRAAEKAARTSPAPSSQPAPAVARAAREPRPAAMAEAPATVAPSAAPAAFGLPQFASLTPGPARAWPRPSPAVGGASPTADAAPSLMPSALGHPATQSLTQRQAWDAQGALQQQLFATLDQLRRRWAPPLSAPTEASCHVGPDTECDDATLRDALAAHTAELSAWLDALRRIDPRAQGLSIAFRDGEYRVSVLPAL